LYWVRVPLKIISVAWKTNKIGERCHKQNRFFRREDFNNNNTITLKTFLGSSPGKNRFSNTQTKHNKRTATKSESFISAWTFPEQKSQTSKLFWVRVPIKMFLKLEG
jgi:hypothetical protein